jgi:N6-L-threonylcarbamoyladenine synthase
MRILAIETSCDDTGIAVLEASQSRFKALSNIVSSQVEVHKKYGGIYPTLAKREHQRNLVPVLEQALKRAELLEKKPKKESVDSGKIKALKNILSREEALFKQLKNFLEKYQKPKINLIAVTTGPGLEPCLWVGVNFAKALAYFWKVPVVPVNHIEGHILVNFLPEINNNFQFSIANFQKIFPAIALVVSGGHTQLVLVKKIGEYKIVGETRDDAAGECFDKAARILGLGYPGGPAISKEAEKFSTEAAPKRLKISFPRPMINSKDYDFSFSGLKTAVLYDYKKRARKTRGSKEYIQLAAKEIQQAIVDVLVKKTIKAAKEYNAKSIILGGGVTANKKLREAFKGAVETQLPSAKLFVPETALSTDNALMVAIAAYFNKDKKTNWKNLRAEANLSIENN